MKISTSAFVSFNQENHWNNHFLCKLFTLFTWLHFYWKRSNLGGERRGSEEELWLGGPSPPFSSILALTFSEARYCISQPQAHLETTSSLFNFNSIFSFLCVAILFKLAQVLLVKKACIRLFSELGMPTWEYIMIWCVVPTLANIVTTSTTGGGVLFWARALLA